MKYTGVDIFPSKFCNYRWLENLPVAGKSLTLLSSMREYCRQAELEKTAPKKHEYDQYDQYVAKAVTRQVAQSKAPFLDILGSRFPPFPCHISDKQAYGTIPCI